MFSMQSKHNKVVRNYSARLSSVINHLKMLMHCVCTRLGLLLRPRQLLLRCPRLLFQTGFYLPRPYGRTFAHPWARTSYSCSRPLFRQFMPRLAVARNISHHPDKGKLGFILSLLLGFSAPAVHADIAILIHGLDSHGASWRYQGVVQRMVNHGWGDAGHLGAYEPVLFIPSSAPIKNKIFTVDLPNEAPIPVQAKFLSDMLHSLRQHYSTEPMSLVGHSAGGLVARLTLVNNPDLNITRLVTIATPHLGSQIATLGHMIKDNPMGMMAGFTGMDILPGDVGLLSDLRPPKNSNFLGWLDKHPHPPIKYISIVRNGGDVVVSDTSQDMNNVPALRGRAQTVVSPPGHALQANDGDILARVLTP